MGWQILPGARTREGRPWKDADRACGDDPVLTDLAAGSRMLVPRGRPRTIADFALTKVQATNNDRNPGQAGKQEFRILYQAIGRELAERKQACRDD